MSLALFLREPFLGALPTRPPPRSPLRSSNTLNGALSTDGASSRISTAVAAHRSFPAEKPLHLSSEKAPPDATPPRPRRCVPMSDQPSCSLATRFTRIVAMRTQLSARAAEVDRCTASSIFFYRNAIASEQQRSTLMPHPICSAQERAGNRARGCPMGPASARNGRSANAPRHVARTGGPPAPIAARGRQAARRRKTIGR